MVYIIYVLSNHLGAVISSFLSLSLYLCVCVCVEIPGLGERRKKKRKKEELPTCHAGFAAWQRDSGKDVEETLREATKHLPRNLVRFLSFVSSFCLGFA